MPFNDSNQTAPWNATTNSPKLVSGAGEPGTRYQVSVAGTTNLDGTADWNEGDILEFMNYTRTWVRVYNAAGAVTGVPDGTYGDITVTNGGTTWTVSDERIQDVSAALWTDGDHAGFNIEYDDANALINISLVDPGGDTIINLTQNRDFKESCRVASTANLTLSGEQTIDGVLTSTSRVLVKDQTNQNENGIYVTAAGAWARADDADENSEVTSGMLVAVEDGSTQSDTIWTLITPDPITVGVTALQFQQVVLPAAFPVAQNNNNTSITIQNNSLSNRWVMLTSNSNGTITVNNTNSIAVNTEIRFQKVGTGNWSFVAGGGVTITAPQGLNLYTRYTYALLKKTTKSGWTLHISAPTYYDLGFQVEDVMTDAEIIARYVTPRAFRVPATATGSYAKAATAATGSTTLTMYKNGVSFGTIAFAGAGTTGTFTVAANTDFAAGDVLTIDAPATADTTLAGLGISLLTHLL